MQVDDRSKRKKLVFCSYAAKDQYFCNELGKHLSQLVRDQIIEQWDRRYILAGSDWKQHSTDKLRKADLILFLVSPDFVSSAYCFDVEVHQAMAQYRNGHSYVIPIITRSVEWHDTPFGMLAPVPTDGKAIRQWKNQDAAWTHVVAEIRKIIDLMNDKKPHLTKIVALQNHHGSDELTRVEIVIQGCYDDMTTEKIDAIINHIRDTLGDGKITVHRLLEGSIVLVLYVSQQSALELVRLYRDGWNRILDHNILDVRLVHGNPLEASSHYRFGDQEAIVLDPEMRQIYRRAEEIARTPATLLLTGETGVGKEVLAKAIHFFSKRSSTGKFVAINAANLPEELMDAELFGVVRGAYTNAVDNRHGIIREADGGTLFIDEITELSLKAQAKLLRVFEDRAVRPIGGVLETKVNFRLIAATNKNIEDEVKAGRFRLDLYYRLNTVMEKIPALRSRPTEIIPIAESFLAAACQAAGKIAMKIPDRTAEFLLSYNWPGNVRELKHVMERAAIVGIGDDVEPWDLPENVLIADKH